MQNSENQLIKNKRLFEKAAYTSNIKLRNGNPNSAIAWAEIAANFASLRHPGFYVSKPLESMLIEIANDIKKREMPSSFSQATSVQAKTSGKRRILHVMTQAYGVGGHTRIVANWVKYTSESCVHSLVTTTQKESLPTYLSSAIKENGGSYIPLPNSESLVNQASLLRQISHTWADLVVLHTHPYDAVPTVAFGEKGGSPVLLFNHADHIFWLGVSISDVVLDFRLLGQNLTFTRRGAKNSKIVPIPLTDVYTMLDRKVIRKKYALGDDKIVLLSVSNEAKFTPFAGYDFIETMTKILRKNPNAVLIVVGPHLKGRWAQASKIVRDRFRVTGEISFSDLQDFYACADIYVDGFPLGGGTTLLEAGAIGLPIIGLHKPEAPNLDGSDDLALHKFNTHATSLGDFSYQLQNMMSQQSSNKQKASKIQESIINVHFPPGWNCYFNDALSSLPHEHSVNISDVPTENSTRGSDAFLAGFQAAVYSAGRKNYLRTLSRPAPRLSSKEKVLFALRYLPKLVLS